MIIIDWNEEVDKKAKDGLYPVFVEPGSKVVSPAQQERNKRYAEMKRQEEYKDMLRHIKEKEMENWQKGKRGFCFVQSECQYHDLSPATAARLVYLATYLSYNGRLLFPNRKPVKKKDLPELMDLSPALISKSFWPEVKGKYLFIDKGKCLYMVDDFFHKGAFKTDRLYQLLYNDSVRKLYHLTPPTKHKYLGHLFQMLPYINRETNILCRDIYEPDIQQCKPLSLSEFCREIDFDVSHRNSLPKIYNGITFDIEGKRERFCSFVTNGVSLDSAIIYVNPHIH